jgi:hypothetical protein
VIGGIKLGRVVIAELGERAGNGIGVGELLLPATEIGPVVGDGELVPGHV